MKIKHIFGFWASGGASDPAGLTLLKEDSYIYVDFGDLVQTDGQIMTSNITAYGTLAATISPLNSPVVSDRLVNGDLHKTLKDESTKCVSSGIAWNTIVNQDFEVWFAVSGGDGATLPNFQICGTVFTADTNRQFLPYLSSGEMRLNWGYTGTRFVYRTTSAILATTFGLTVVCLRVDFANDTVTTYVDGVAVAGTFSSGTIVGKTPASFDNTNVCFIASGNDGAGAAISNTTSPNYFHDFAIKGLSTAEERSQIFEYLTTQKYE